MAKFTLTLSAFSEICVCHPGLSVNIIFLWKIDEIKILMRLKYSATKFV